GITGDSLEPVPEFRGIDVLAFAVVAPWSKMAETIDFLRAVAPVLALPVHDAIASDVGRPIFLRQYTDLAPAGTHVRAGPGDGVVEVGPAWAPLEEHDESREGQRRPGGRRGRRRPGRAGDGGGAAGPLPPRLAPASGRAGRAAADRGRADQLAAHHRGGHAAPARRARGEPGARSRGRLRLDHCAAGPSRRT